MKLRGYISSRKLEDGNLVDQSVQNLVIKQACEKFGFSYLLSATEYGMKNCFLMLQDLIQGLKNKKFDGIAFYSIEQLPRSEKLRNKLYKSIIFYKKRLLFSLEKIQLKSKNEIQDFELMLKIKNLQQFSLKETLQKLIN